MSVKSKLYIKIEISDKDLEKKNSNAKRRIDQSL